jgi:hypothetical protein
MAMAQSVFFTWLYRSSRSGLLLVILGHAAVDTVARFVLPQFTATDYYLVWWWQSAIWVLAAIAAGVSVSGVRRDQEPRAYERVA